MSVLFGLAPFGEAAAEAVSAGCEDGDDEGEDGEGG